MKDKMKGMIVIMSDAKSRSLDKMLDKMFNPRAVAIVGASNTAGKQGNTVVRYLKQYGYTGNVYPVNPKENEIEGLKCYRSVADLPSDVDLGILCLPSKAVPAEAENCGKKGIHFLVVWTAGFGEADAGDLEKKFRDICEEWDIKVCGPNSLGIINTNNGLTATFTTALSNKPQLIGGRVALISQSGGTAAAIIDDLLRQSCGFNTFVSSGNELNLGFSDYCRELLEYDGIDVIAGYVEGIRDGQQLIGVGRRAKELGKHIILVKGGRSMAAVDAVRSHTGAIAGNDGVYRAAFAEAGIIQAKNTEILMDLIMLLSNPRQNPAKFGRRAVVLSTGGGSGVQALDAVDMSTLETAKMEDKTIETIKSLVPAFAGVSRSMVDMTPQMLTDPNYLKNLGNVFKAVEDDPNVDITFFLMTSQGPVAPKICAALDAHQETAKKPLLMAWRALPDVAREMLQKSKIHVYSSPDRMIQSAETLAQYGEYASAMRERTPVSAQTPAPRIEWPQLVFEKGSTVVTEDKVTPWLEHYGISTASGRLAKDADEAVQAAETLGYPLVAKVIGRGLPHRSKHNLVALNLKDKESLRSECERLFSTARGLNAGVVDGVWVQQFRPGGLELIVGGFRDEAFGDVMVCGIGGYLAEFFQPSYRLLPIDAQEANKMISELKFLKKYPEGIDKEALQETLVNFSRLLADCPWKKFELELNPVKVMGPGKGVFAVDALAVVRE